MKPMEKAALGFAAFLLITNASSAQLLVENFNYTAGDALTAHGWFAHSGAGTNPLTLVSGSLAYPGYPSSAIGNAVTMSRLGGEDVHCRFDSTASGSLYVSFLVNVASASANGDYFVHLAQSPIGGNTFSGRVFAKDSGSGQLLFGVSFRANNTNGAQFTASTYSFGVTYLIVMKYTFGAIAGRDQAILWVNPNLSGTEPEPDLASSDTVLADPSNIALFALRQATSTSSPALTIDGIRIGNNWSDVPLHVQLTSFWFQIAQHAGVMLNWSTATEINNYGFEVQRSASGGDGFQGVSGLIPGHGTTNVPQSYSFTDNGGFAGAYYRLKQIDLDQSVHFTEPIQVTGVTGVNDQVPASFGLEQNYPNPFNPSTAITYSLSATGLTTLVVYDLLGNEVATPVNAEQGPGSYSVSWNAKDMASGVYFYRLTSGGRSELRRMMLVK